MFLYSCCGHGQCRGWVICVRSYAYCTKPCRLRGTCAHLCLRVYVWVCSPPSSPTHTITRTRSRTRSRTQYDRDARYGGSKTTKWEQHTCLVQSKSEVRERVYKNGDDKGSFYAGTLIVTPDYCSSCDIRAFHCKPHPPSSLLPPSSSVPPPYRYSFVTSCLPHSIYLTLNPPRCTITPAPAAAMPREIGENKHTYFESQKSAEEWQDRFDTGKRYKVSRHPADPLREQPQCSLNQSPSALKCRTMH